MGGSVTGCIALLPSPTHAHAALLDARWKGDLRAVKEILDEGWQDINAQDGVSHMILYVCVYLYKPLHLPVHGGSLLDC